MNAKTRKLLGDIAGAAQFIRRELAGMTMASYLENETLRLAVERQFEVIGEACRRIALSDPAVATRIGSIADIIAFRNLIAHGYDVVDHARVLEIAQMQVPRLLTDVGILLESAE